MRKWCRLAIESENVGVLATKFVALIANAWEEDGLLRDVQIHFRRSGDSSVEYLLSPTAALLVRRGGTLEPYRSRLTELEEKPDTEGFKRIEL